MVDHRAALKDFTHSVSKDSSTHVWEWTQQVEAWETGKSKINPYVSNVKHKQVYIIAERQY